MCARFPPGCIIADLVEELDQSPWQAANLPKCRVGSAQGASIPAAGCCHSLPPPVPCPVSAGRVSFFRVLLSSGVPFLQDHAGPHLRLWRPPLQQHPIALAAPDQPQSLLEDLGAEPGSSRVCWLPLPAACCESPVKINQLLKEHNHKCVPSPPPAVGAYSTNAEVAVLKTCNGSAVLCVTPVTDAGAHGDGGSKKSGPRNVSSEDMWLSHPWRPITVSWK